VCLCAYACACACACAQRSGREVAIKVFLKNRMDREDKQALVEEVTILSNLKHNNVIT
jgi:hypothetical protein